MSKVVVSQPFLDKTLAVVEVASLFAKQAGAELDVHRQAQKRAAELRPALLDHLIQVGLVAPQSKQACEAMLASHAETLQLLKAAADKLVEAHAAAAKDQAPALGTGVPEKAASAAPAYDSLRGPYVGLRTSETKASDVEFARILDEPGF